MGFLDWLTGKIKCPRCGTRGAKEINGAVHCPNPSCSYFSASMGKGSASAPQDSSAFGQQQEDAAGGFSSGPSMQVPEGWFAIRYRNFRGQEKSFVADAASARRKNNHISVKVGEGKRMVTIRDPQTGEPHRVRQEIRIALSRDRILNLSEVEAAMPHHVAPGQDWPSPRERQVMTYHKKRGTTSALYETIRAKYPDW